MCRLKLDSARILLPMELGSDVETTDAGDVGVNCTHLKR